MSEKSETLQILLETVNFGAPISETHSPIPNMLLTARATFLLYPFGARNRNCLKRGWYNTRKQDRTRQDMITQTQPRLRHNTPSYTTIIIIITINSSTTTTITNPEFPEEPSAKPTLSKAWPLAKAPNSPEHWPLKAQLSRQSLWQQMTPTHWTGEKHAKYIYIYKFPLLEYWLHPQFCY